MAKETPKPKKDDNPIEYHYKGRPVRKYPLIQIRVSRIQYEQFIDAKINFGLSPEQAIAQGKALCNLCNGGIQTRKTA
jgi:hypothetical protein